MWNVMKFWLEMGVDGFRLDAVRLWSNVAAVEIADQTHDILKELRRRLINVSLEGCF